MRRTRSITARLSLVFLSLLLLVIALGVFSIGSLSYFNGVSSQVRDRWLPSTRALGDLNNLTSDFRAAEAASLLAVDATGLAAGEKELESLDRSIEASERAYLQIPRDTAEDSLYRAFDAHWQQYRRIVGNVRALASQGDRVAAVQLYNTTSKVAYDGASDTLGLLTDRNVMSAHEASVREAAAYTRARWLIILTMALAGLAVAGAMRHVHRSISNPLLGLAERMHRLAENETKIDVHGTQRQDEIGEMARAVVVFRDNAIELINSRFGLERQAAMLQEKLAEEQRLPSASRASSGQ